MDAKKKRERDETQKQPVPDKEDAQKRSALQGLQLLLVQSAACVLVILLALLLRLVGGEWFASAGALLKQGLTDHTLVITVASLLDGATVSAAESAPAGAQPHDRAFSWRSPANGAAVCAPLVGGEISSRFGERADPFDTSKTDIHEGLDIAAPEGTTLRAMKTGTVADVACEDGYGNLLIVQCDDGSRYLYAHCASVTVTVETQVKAGDAVGTVGSTGRSTGPHLHLEWRQDGELIDPETVVPEQTYA